MILKPRINFKRIPYSFLEGEIDTSVETDIGDALTEFANYALALEDAAVEFGFTPDQHPMVQEAIKQGAVPAVPDMETQQPKSARANALESCPLCSGPSKVDQTKTGKRVLKCDNGCMDEVNGRQYAHTIRWL